MFDHSLQQYISIVLSYGTVGTYLRGFWQIGLFAHHSFFFFFFFYSKRKMG
jgi:hypothetical protein